MHQADTRSCSRCGGVFSVGSFTPIRTRPAGYMSACKACESQRKYAKRLGVSFADAADRLPQSGRSDHLFDTPTGLRLVRTNELRARLEAQIRPAETGCWEWQGYRWGRYALMFTGHNPKTNRPIRELVHRVSYRVFKGPIPSGLHIDHLCRNTVCVNPAHLEAVTPRENLLRQWKARRDAQS